MILEFEQQGGLFEDPASTINAATNFAQSSCKSITSQKRAPPDRPFCCACDLCLLFQLLSERWSEGHIGCCMVVDGAAPWKILALSLQDWAEYLAADKVVDTMHVDEDDQHMEGPYCLARVTGSEFSIPVDSAHSRQQ